MPAQKFRWDESSGGDSAGEWRCVLPRKKPARKSETATAQDSKDTSKTGVKGSDRRRTYLEVILNTQRDSENEQQNDVDMSGADAGAKWGSCGCVWCFCGYGNDIGDWREEESSRRGKTPHGADPGGFGSVGLWRRHEGSTGQAQPRDVEGSEPQHLANDIEGKAAWVSREARWLNELEADIAKLQAHLIQKRRDLQVEIQELDVLRAQLAKNTGCVGAGNQGNEPPYARAGKT